MPVVLATTPNHLVNINGQRAAHLCSFKPQTTHGTPTPVNFHHFVFFFFSFQMGERKKDVFITVIFCLHPAAEQILQKWNIVLVKGGRGLLGLHGGRKQILLAG